MKAPPKPRSAAAVRAAAEQLRYHLRRTLGGLESEFPEGRRSRLNTAAMRADSNDYPLHMIVAPLDDALESLNLLQESLGRQREYTRFHKFLRGQCTCGDK